MNGLLLKLSGRETCSLRLNNGDSVAVIGGGPAGSFFSYFLLDMAERAGLRIRVDIFEPRDFDFPGPSGCNMCGGVLHESLVQSLALEGINLPDTVVQRGMGSNVLHMQEGAVWIEASRYERRIATTFRGGGPRGFADFRSASLDGFLLKLAVSKGARHIRARVDDLLRMDRGNEPGIPKIEVRAHKCILQPYDLVIVSTGVNTSLLKHLPDLELDYQPPETSRTYIREYFLNEVTVQQYLGDAMHAFLLDIPGLDFGAIIPKGGFITVCLLGQNLGGDPMKAFTNHPVVKACMPPSWDTESFSCCCSPRINTKGSRQPFGDRILFIGDSGITRLYKDGIGAAYRSAKAAAAAVVFTGISADDFLKNFQAHSRRTENDNRVGKLLFWTVRQIKRARSARQGVLNMVFQEQSGQASPETGMSMLMWDMFTGSSSYTEIFLRTLCPVFWTRFLWSLMAAALLSKKNKTASGSAAGHFAKDLSIQVQAKEKNAMGEIGREYQDGETIIRQGEIGNCMFVIQEGHVEIIDELHGKEVRLAMRGAGDFFGEMAIFEQERRTATVRAVGKARILTVDEKTFLRRIHQDPTLAYRLVKTMSHRLRELSQEMAVLKNYDPETLLARQQYETH